QGERRTPRGKRPTNPRERLSRYRASSDPNPRVRKTVSQIDKKVHQDAHQGNEEHKGLDRTRILEREGLDRIIADARPAEDTFDHGVARHQKSEDDAERGDHRNNGVAERISVYDKPTRQAECPCGLD